jgi:hypothetical protein
VDDGKYEVLYLYRDAGNSKFRGSFVLRGQLDLEPLRPLLFDREWFVPERIGLPPLRPTETTKDDHWLHEFEEIVPYSGPQEGIPASELTRRIREVGAKDGWLEGAWWFVG